MSGTSCTSGRKYGTCCSVREAGQRGCKLGDYPPLVCCVQLFLLEEVWSVRVITRPTCAGFDAPPLLRTIERAVYHAAPEK